MKYYVLSVPITGKYIAGEVEFEPKLVGYYRYVDSSTLLSGSKVLVRLWPRAKALNVDLFAPGQGFFISRKIANALQEFTNDVELVRASIFFHNGTPVEGEYYLMHVKHRLAAFDTEKSEFRENRKNKNHIATDTNPATNIEKLVLNEAVVAGIDAFYLKSVGFYAPIVSENIYDKLVQLKLKNILLTPVDTYRDPY